MSLPRFALTALPLLALAFGSSPAMAHAGHEAGAAAGFLHPLMGLDHVAAMVAIGLWAAQIGGGRGWMLPAGFLAGMAGGISLSLAGGMSLSVGGIEAGVAASVIILGVMLAMARPFKAAMALPMVMAAGLFHGMAHGGEIGGALLPTALGMLAGSALLHGLGMIAGAAMTQHGRALRFGGAAIAGLGALLLVV